MEQEDYIRQFALALDDEIKAARLGGGQRGVLICNSRRQRSPIAFHYFDSGYRRRVDRSEQTLRGAPSLKQG